MKNFEDYPTVSQFEMTIEQQENVAAHVGPCCVSQVVQTTEKIKTQRVGIPSEDGEQIKLDTPRKVRFPVDMP